MTTEVYVLIGIIIIISLYILVTYNILIKLRNGVNESFSTMDVYLKKRWELIPNIVETVKGYAKHEKDTITKVTELRMGNYDTLSVNSKIDKNGQLTPAISKMMLLAEAYPELKANENYADLSKQLTKVEEDIANARKYFNAVVKEHNNKVEMVPSNIIAKIFGFKSQKMFEVTGGERESIDLKL